MDDTIRAVLDQMPEKTRSKLEPHADVIRDLRRKGRTYQDIARFFAERFSLKVAPSTIHAFVRVRALRHRRFRVELPTALNDSDPALSKQVQEAEIRRRIDALKRRQPQGEVEKPQFRYDEDEPLELIQGRINETKGN
jgi:hypothetical protein